MDALLIGGNTATLHEGKIVQYGKTVEVYNKPKNVISAKVFNDPPINTTKIVKKDKTFSIKNNSVSWSCQSNLEGLADGPLHNWDSSSQHNSLQTDRKFSSN
jgi:glycerol transport system ATP-binding protein